MNEEQQNTADLDRPDPLERLTNRIESNHANTLAFLACLRVIDSPISYAEAEDLVAELPAMSITTQTPHTLFELLIDAGGIERIQVASEQDSESENETFGEELTQDLNEPDGDEANELDDDQDYLLEITEAGRQVLEAYEPTRRFMSLLEAEPEGYADVYRQLLTLCENGAKLSEIENELGNHPAMTNPKQVYPNYFVSKLESIEGISWDGCWRTTETGKQMLDLLNGQQ